MNCSIAARWGQEAAAMSPTLDDLLGATMTLVRGLRSAGHLSVAEALMTSLTGGCSAPELVHFLRVELLNLPEGLPEDLAEGARSLVEGLTGWLEDEGY
jgi:hypothetical protein